MNTRRPLLPPRDNAMSPRETLNYFLDRFCSNLNCVTSFCPTHCACFKFSPSPLVLNELIAVQVRTPVPVAPKIDPEKLGEAVMESCGRNCFMHPTTGDSTIVRPPVVHNTSSPKFHGQGSLWTPTDIETLHVTLDYAPDTLPCDLAVIVRKPCREVRHLWLGPSCALLTPRAVRANPSPGLPPTQSLRVPRTPTRACIARHIHTPRFEHARREEPQDGYVCYFPSPLCPFTDTLFPQCNTA